MEKIYRKAGYLAASALAVILLLLQTPLQRFFSYQASTTYTLSWIWLGMALVAVLAVVSALSLCWSQGLPRKFRIPAEGVKAALALITLIIEFFYYKMSSKTSIITIFGVVLFLTGFFVSLTRKQ